MIKKKIMFCVLLVIVFINSCRKESAKSYENIQTTTEIEESSETECVDENKKEVVKSKPVIKKIHRKESVKLNVTNIQQLPEYRCGCEITSATILLNYLGYNVSKVELAKFLQIVDFYYEDGVYYSGDPLKEFCGTLEEGFGCYSCAIEEALNNYFFSINEKRQVINLTGAEPEVLYNNVSEGRPVLVWVTISMLESSDGWHWIIKETGEEYVWKKNEHCVVLIGYTPNTVILSDPYDIRGEVEYPKELFEERYRQMSSNAIVIK